MAAQTLTYLEIPLETRREAAAKARTNLRSLLSNPGCTSAQRAEIRAQLEKVAHWEAGLLTIDGVTPPEAPPAVGFAKIRITP